MAGPLKKKSKKNKKTKHEVFEEEKISNHSQRSDIGKSLEDSDPKSDQISQENPCKYKACF